MKPVTGALDQVVNGLGRTEVLQVLAYIGRRLARDTLLKHLLQARLDRMLAPSAVPSDPGELLTADEAAKRLKLSRARIYELIRQGQLEAVRVGQRQVRIPVRALTSPPPTTLTSQHLAHP